MTTSTDLLHDPHKPIPTSLRGPSGPVLGRRFPAPKSTADADGTSNHDLLAKRTGLLKRTKRKLTLRQRRPIRAVERSEHFGGGDGHRTLLSLEFGWIRQAGEVHTAFHLIRYALYAQVHACDGEPVFADSCKSERPHAESLR